MPTAQSVRSKAKAATKDSNAITRKKPVARNRKQKCAAERWDKGPWEPNAQELEVFARCIRYEPLASIGADIGQSAVWVMRCRDKVGQWKAEYENDRIEAIRARVTQTYEHVITEALDAWNTVKALSLVPELKYDKEGNVASVNVPGGSPGDGYLKTVVASLNEIRKIWSTDKIPEKQKPPGGDDKRDDGSNGMRVAGKSRNEVLSELISKIQGKISQTSTN